jgi:hypothetical protein
MRRDRSIGESGARLIIERVCNQSRAYKRIRPSDRRTETTQIRVAHGQYVNPRALFTRDSERLARRFSP